MLVEVKEVGMVRDVVERLMIAEVPLVFPDVDKCIAISNLSPPTSHQVHLVLRVRRNFGIPISHRLDVFIDLVGFDVVKDDRMDILAASK